MPNNNSSSFVISRLAALAVACPVLAFVFGLALDPASAADPVILPAGTEVARAKDPLAVYKEAGIDLEQERKIRKFAKEFEDQQRVRLKLMANLLKEMRQLELLPDPDEKKALDKQVEINKVQNDISIERIKLLLRIRNVMTFEQKERLVSLIQKNLSGAAPTAVK